MRLVKLYPGLIFVKYPFSLRDYCSDVEEKGKYEDLHRSILVLDSIMTVNVEEDSC